MQTLSYFVQFCIDISQVVSRHVWPLWPFPTWKAGHQLVDGHGGHGHEGHGHEGHEGHEGHDQKERQHGREQGLKKDNLRVTWHLTLLSFFFKRHLSLKFHTDTHFLKIFWTSPQEKSEKFNIESWKSESYHGFFSSNPGNPVLERTVRLDLTKPRNKRQQQGIFECSESFPSFLKWVFSAPFTRVFPCWGYLLRGG